MDYSQVDDDLSEMLKREKQCRENSKSFYDENLTYYDKDHQHKNNETPCVLKWFVTVNSDYRKSEEKVSNAKAIEILGKISEAKDVNCELLIKALLSIDPLSFHLASVSSSLQSIRSMIANTEQQSEDLAALGELIDLIRIHKNDLL